MKSILIILALIFNITLFGQTPNIGSKKEKQINL